MRADDPAAAAARASSRPARPGGPGQRRPPAVREDLRHHRRRRGLGPRPPPASDAIGLNLVPGTPRALAELEEAAASPRLARAAGGRPARRGSSRSPPTPGRRARRDRGGASTPTSSSSTARAGRRRRIQRPAWKVLHLPADATTPTMTSPRDLVRAARPAYLAAGSNRILLDTSGGPHPGGTGHARRRTLAAAVARTLPVILAGGLDRPTSPALLDDRRGRGRRRVRRRAAPRPRAASDQGPAPGRAVRQARPSRPHDRPTCRVRPDAGRPGLLEADAAAAGAGTRLRWPLRARDADGRASTSSRRLRRAPPRPALLGRAARAARYVRRPADPALPRRPARRGRPPSGAPARARAAPAPAPVPQARGPRPHRRAQDQQRARPGAAHAPARQDAGHRRDRRRPARRRDRDRLRAARAAVRRLHGRRGHRAPGAQRAPDARARRRGPRRSRRARRRSRTRSTRRCATGSPTSRRPTTCSARRWARIRTPRSCATSSAGSATRPRPAHAVEGRLPDLAIACVGGGSNAIGLLAGSSASRRSGSSSSRRPATGSPTGQHAAALAGGLARASSTARGRSCSRTPTGRSSRPHSISAGLDYPGVGPQLAALAEAGRLEVAAATDDEAVAAMAVTARTEGILPALETAHAIAALRASGRHDGERWPWPDDALVLLGFSGRGDKDLAALERFADVERWAASVTAAATPGPNRRRTAAPGGSRRPSRPRDGGPRRAHPVRRRGLPGRRDELRGRARRHRRRRRPARGRPAVLGSARRRRDAPARVGVALAAGATLERSLALDRRIGGRPDLPLVPMGYANQVIGGGDGEAVASTARRSRGRRVYRRRPHARRGRAVRGGRPSRRPRARLPRRADHAAGAPRVDRGAQRRVPLLRVARRRDRRPRLRCRRSGLVRDVKARRRCPVAVGFGVSRPAHVGRSRRPERMGSSSRRPSSMRSGPMAVTGLATLVGELRAATHRGRLAGRATSTVSS